jgi:hypothetical protein
LGTLLNPPVNQRDLSARENGEKSRQNAPQRVESGARQRFGFELENFRGSEVSRNVANTWILLEFVSFNVHLEAQENLKNTSIGCKTSPGRALCS